MSTRIKKDRVAAKRIERARAKKWLEDNPPPPIEKMFICLRIYPNGEIKVEPRFARDKDDWIEHNATWRFGQALFVDGEYISPKDGENHHEWAYEFKDEIESHTDEARELLEAKHIPSDWHLSEGRYYPPGCDFVSSGSYMQDEISDMKHGPFKF